MMRVSLPLAVAAALLLGSNSGAMAETQGEFGNACATSLAFGKTYKTDCSVNTVYQGKTYCFGNERSREVFLKNPDKVLAKAQANYSTKKP
jgi:YHS domain-containing protein